MSTLQCGSNYCNAVQAVADGADAQTCSDYNLASEKTCSVDAQSSLCCNNDNIHKMSTKCDIQNFSAAQAHAKNAMKDFQNQSFC